MDIKKRLEETAKGQIDLHIGGAAGKGSLTRFGGAPDLPEGFEWPRYGYGDETPLPLAFLAQFDCSGLAKHDKDGLLPHEGVLSFFYEYRSQRWGYDPKDEGCARVYWFKDISGLKPSAFPADLPEDCRFPALSIGMSAGRSVMSPADAQMAWQTDIDYDDFEMVRRRMGCGEPENSSKLLGWADPIQDSMAAECQLVTRGYDMGGDTDAPERELIYAEEHSIDDWTLLFQLDTVEEGHFYLMFGDCGRIYFYIRKEDLAARRFDRAWLVLQCY